MQLEVARAVLINCMTFVTHWLSLSSNTSISAARDSILGAFPICVSQEVCRKSTIFSQGVCEIKMSAPWSISGGTVVDGRDWFSVSLYPDGQTIGPFLRICLVWAVLRRHSPEVWRSSVLGLPTDPGIFLVFPVYMTNSTFSNWRDWLRDIDFEHCLGAHVRGALVVWHNMELFSVPLLTRSQLYAGTP